MGFWFTLIVCAACLNISYAQSVGQDGLECNKLERLIFRQAQDLASMMTTLITISSRQEERMAEIETRIVNIETKMANNEIQLGNVKTEVINNVQTKLANIENQISNVTAQIVDVQTRVTWMGVGNRPLIYKYIIKPMAANIKKHNQTYNSITHREGKQTIQYSADW